MALGQDGLVANTLDYLDSHPLIGVNPDPKRWGGVLLPFNVNDIGTIVPEVFGEKRQIQEVTMAKAQLNNGQSLYGVNDIFIGPKSHTSARYTIKLHDKQEQHSSSGVIVSTGLGSTGWLKSLLAGANAIANKQKVSGKITQHSQLRMTSLMPENGVIFSDGIETDYLEFNSGIVAELGIAEKKGHLVV